MDRYSCGLEVKFAGDAQPGMFAGYGAIFGNEDFGGDVIVKGAFKDTLKDIKKTGLWPSMFLEHGYFMGGDTLPIGVWTDMEEDDKGLRVEGKLATETQRGAEIYSLLKMDPRPAIQGLSIGYRAKEFIYGTKPTEPPRTLKKVDLYEVSLVAMACNPLAQVEDVKRANRKARLEEFARRLRDGEPPAVKEFEDLLRDAGVPKSMAVQIASVGYAKAIRSESEGKSVSPDVISEFKNAITQFGQTHS